MNAQSTSPELRRKTRVLVVDDSALMRKMLTDILTSVPDIEVIGVARDGEDALNKIQELQPDVVTLDLLMPRMNGLEALRRIRAQSAIPVVVITGINDEDAIRIAQDLGANEIVRKPSGPVSLDLDTIAATIIYKVQRAALISEQPMGPQSEPSQPEKRTSSETRQVVSPDFKPIKRFAEAKLWAVVIGASTGGPRAVEYVLTHLPPELPTTLLIVQHMPPGFTRSFAERLDALCSLHVKEAEEDDVLRREHAYIAPGGYHLRVVPYGATGRIRLDQSPPVNGVRPSVDVTMRDVAQVFGERTVGVLLTGMGSDGAQGMKAIKEVGGITIAQDETSSTVFGMPRAASALGVVDMMRHLEEIPQAIVQVIRTRKRGKQTR